MGNLEESIVLQYHWKETNRKYYCNMCPFTAAKKWKILEHTKYHNDIPGISLFECQLCLFRAPLKAQFDRHIMFAHANDMDLRKYSCKQCGETYISKSGLHKHKSLGHYRISEK